MRPNFFIKYRGINASNDSAVDLVALGESIIGFDALIKDIFEISKINGEVSVSATKTRDGSLIVDILVSISNIANAIPFERVEDLLNFLRIVDHNAWELANNFFNDLTHAHRTLNDYFAANSLDYTLACSFVAYLIGRAKKHKQKPDLDDLPKDYAIALHKAIKARKFKKAISPLIENEVTSIEVSDDRDFGRESTAVIDASNFENYLFDFAVMQRKYPTITKENYDTVVNSAAGNDLKAKTSDFITLCGLSGKISAIDFKMSLAQSIVSFDDVYSELKECINN